MSTAIAILDGALSIAWRAVILAAIGFFLVAFGRAALRRIREPS